MSEKKEIARRIHDEASKLIQQADAAGLFKLSYMLEKVALEAARNSKGSTGSGWEAMLLH